MFYFAQAILLTKNLSFSYHKGFEDKKSSEIKKAIVNETLVSVRYFNNWTIISF